MQKDFVFSNENGVYRLPAGETVIIKSINGSKAVIEHNGRKFTVATSMIR